MKPFGLPSSANWEQKTCSQCNKDDVHVIGSERHIAGLCWSCWDNVLLKRFEEATVECYLEDLETFAEYKAGL